MGTWFGAKAAARFWSNIKNTFVAQEEGKGLSSNDFTDAEKTQLANLVATGGEVNVIETIKFNGTALEVTDKTVELSAVVASDLESYYTKTEVDNKVSAIPKFAIEVVSELPTTNIGSATVYLVSTGNETDNLYTEYIYANGAWETLGTQKCDLSNYATKDSTIGAVAVTAAAGGTVTVTVTAADGSTTKSSSATIPAATQDQQGLMIGSDKKKLDEIAAGAEVNVQANWSETDTDSDAYILNKPTSLPANGGNADTVAGHSVGTDVPSTAKFTDTTYSDFVGATSEAAGSNGLVPAPAAGEETYLLSGSGVWVAEMTDAEVDAICV